ncbi:5-hydroxyisourate hydrolase-like [Moschus berezovskii]|uniref:5-hydroxyisourate hydrolase-like n=1 Tax=Moschus berezovskii TaxID=68408 RepID=UPI002443A4F4|nr:5-hydroxyisourate hydrolase-like [Moschus berezovskii]
MNLWEGKVDEVDACLAGKLRTLEACTFTVCIVLVLADVVLASLFCVPHQKAFQHTALCTCTVLDDRCPGLLPPGQIKTLACKLSFNTKGYWQKRGQESFYPYVCRPVCLRVVFTITDETHKYHGLPLLSPWAYTTYRGS